MYVAYLARASLGGGGGGGCLVVVAKGVLFYLESYNSLVREIYFILTVEILVSDKKRAYCTYRCCCCCC